MKTIIFIFAFFVVISGNLASPFAEQFYIRKDVPRTEGGSLILPYDPNPCSEALAGAIRYNSAAKRAEVCHRNEWRGWDEP